MPMLGLSPEKVCLAAAARARLLGDHQFRIETESMQGRGDFLSIHRVHQNNGVGSKLTEGVRRDDFLARTGDEPARFSRIDIYDVRDGGSRWIYDIQKGHCLRSRSPHNGALFVSPLPLE